jgi:hypothetical protein
MNRYETGKQLPPMRTATVTIWLQGGEYWARYRNNHTLDVSPPAVKLNITQSMLANILAKMRNKLEEIATANIWSLLKDPLDQPPAGLATERFSSFMAAVASEGATLYDHLINKSDFGKYIIKLNDLEHGSSITIETDNASIPWEILYPLPYNIDWTPEVKEKHKIEPEQLWGYRFLIEHIIFPPLNRSFGPPPLQEHRRGNTFVSLNLNPTIDKAFENRPYKPIEAHKDFFKTSLEKRSLGEIRMKGDEIKRVLLSESQATIIYLFCHGKADNPFLDKTGEQLQLDEKDYIEPSFFDDRSGVKFQRGPIVILNSCSSGAYSPLSFSTFYEKLIERRALGVIGTTLPMPATFAAAFGLRLMKSYLEDTPKPTIGKALRKMRQDLLDKSNPLGLFYQLQCYLHVTRPN